MKTKILFFSRHRMTNEQAADLERIFPLSEVKTLDATVKNAEELLRACEGCDVLAAVLPLHMYADFFKIKPPELRVIFARSKRVPTEKNALNKDTGEYESRYAFVHDGWIEITRLDCELQKL